MNVFVISILIFFCIVPRVMADTRGGYLSVIFENDIFFQEDGGYTNGLGIAYGRGTFNKFTEENTPSFLLPLIENTYINKGEEKSRAISYMFGQAIGTPEDITTETLIEDQQPYAGALIGRVTFYEFDAKKTNHLALILGLVGPYSYAEQAQKTVHKYTGGQEPKGWDNQLNTEPVFRIEMASSNKFSSYSYFNEAIDLEFVGAYHAGIGNVRSDAGYSLGFRLGSNLDDIVNIAADTPGREVNSAAGLSGSNWMIYADIVGKYVFNDIFIDGNYFSDSHSVDLVHEQALFNYGVTYQIDSWAISFMRSVSTKTYRTQSKSANFGAVNITYKL